MTYVFSRFVLSLSVLVIALLSLTGLAQACGSWTLIASPNPSPYSNHLQAVAALSPHNAYAVGSSLTVISKSSQFRQPLIEHFNGSIWSVMASPSIGPGLESTLTGIVAISATNIYAVGTVITGGGLIEHFDGSHWSVVGHQPACNFNAIVAISATDMYTVGASSCIVHFNGTSWNKVASGTSNTALFAVTAVSSTNVYAVGSVCVGATCDRGNGTFQTLIEHFNGVSWSVVKSPSPSGNYNSLNGVAAVSATNILAVGSYAPSFQPGASSPLIERFNGSTWSVVKSPNVKGSSSLNAIAVVSATNIDAVGQASIPTAPAYPPLIEHFNGSTWSIVSSPSAGMSNMLNGVARVFGTSQLFAVGSSDKNTLIEFTC